MNHQTNGDHGPSAYASRMAQIREADDLEVAQAETRFIEARSADLHFSMRWGSTWEDASEELLAHSPQLPGADLLAALRERRAEAIEAARLEHDTARAAVEDLRTWGPTRLHKPLKGGDNRSLIPRSRRTATVVHLYEYGAGLPICGRLPDGSSEILYQSREPRPPYYSLKWCDRCRAIQMEEVDSWLKAQGHEI